MAKYRVYMDLQIGGGQLKAGEIIDSASHDITGLLAAGAMLVDVTTAPGTAPFAVDQAGPVGFCVAPPAALGPTGAVGATGATGATGPAGATGPTGP